MTDTLTTDSAISQVSGVSAAAQTAITSSTVDMRGYSQVAFIVSLGAVDSGGAGSIQLQEGDSSDGSDCAAVTGSVVTYDASDDNQVCVLEQRNLTARYCRVVITRSGADSAVNSIIAIRSGGGYRPVTQSTDDVASSDLFV